MRLGCVVLPDAPWAVAQARWRRVEELGFDVAWTYDHLVWGGLVGHDWYGAWPTLAAAAGVTERVRLGTLVTSPNLRHPVPLAQEVMTLDDISGGRLELGIGAGSAGPDATVLGRDPWPAGERADRFAATVELLDRLLTAPVTTAAVGPYAARAVHLRPGCVQRPRVPFTVAATGPRGMRVAARHGAAWVTTGSARPLVGPAFHGVGAQCRALQLACEGVGRDPATLRRVLMADIVEPAAMGSVEAFRDLAGRYAALGFDELVMHLPRSEPPYDWDEGTFERICAEVLPELRAA